MIFQQTQITIIVPKKRERIGIVYLYFFLNKIHDYLKKKLGLSQKHKKRGD
jgi:hypothetical protein